MKIFYLDASAWVKRYFEETGTACVEELFGRIDASFCCSPLGFIEVLATVFRKLKAGELELEKSQQIQQELTKDWNLFIRVRFTKKVEHSARKVVEDFALRGADSIHLASAFSLNEQLENEGGIVFVASDKELKTAAWNSGLEVLDPTDNTESSI